MDVDDVVHATDTLLLSNTLLLGFAVGTLTGGSLGKDDFVDADAFYLGLEPGHDMHGFRSHGIYASGQLSVALLTISWVLSTAVAFSLSLSPCRRDEQFLARWRVVFTPLILMSMLTLVAGVLLFFWMYACYAEIAFPHYCSNDLYVPRELDLVYDAESGELLEVTVDEMDSCLESGMLIVSFKNVVVYCVFIVVFGLLVYMMFGQYSLTLLHHGEGSTRLAPADEEAHALAKALRSIDPALEAYEGALLDAKVTAAVLPLLAREDCERVGIPLGHTLLLLNGLAPRPNARRAPRPGARHPLTAVEPAEDSRHRASPMLDEALADHRFHTLRAGADARQAAIPALLAAGQGSC
eukprot:CAMPEP_0196695122 /NCGR_PEP_ID=MMETSP1090-20130531/35740_1 /TAXON_ID=37098 /ORGANISM="Isochrysis sp, Strain CCMP1244" /LENGTH=352 /DNA_ID=CAMNT_0042034641 /DNA_START=63 /DNA_END=1121 /DNA_ORIENTATION=+